MSQYNFQYFISLPWLVVEGGKKITSSYVIFQK